MKEIVTEIEKLLKLEQLQSLEVYVLDNLQRSYVSILCHMK